MSSLRQVAGCLFGPKKCTGVLLPRLGLHVQKNRHQSYLSSVCLSPSVSSVSRLKKGPVYEPSPHLVTPTLCYFYQPSRNAGHSKWANIKHIKGLKDAEKSRELTRFGNMMRIAIKEGGGSADPKVNSKLAQIISQMKDRKLPMASVDRLLNSEANKKDEKQLTIVIKGPGSAVYLTDISTSALIKTKQELNVILRKNKGLMAEDSLTGLFLHKGILRSNEVNGKPADQSMMDDVLSSAIEAGADDVTFQDDDPDFGKVFEFTTTPETFYRVKHALEKMNFVIVYGDLEYLPLNPIQLDQTDLESAEKLYTKLTEHPSVVRITTNIA